jgi:hypothetical protein
MPSPRNRGRIKLVMIAVAGTAIAVGIGIGTADANVTHWSAQGHHWSSPAPSAIPSTTAAVPSSSPPASRAPSATVPPVAVPSSTTRTNAWAPPPANGVFDYQIGESYAPAAGVTVVSRDHDASPAPGLYNICYVNAFQAQSDAASWWKAEHPDLLLRDAQGNLVVDGDWDEILLDYSSATKRAALTTVVGGWIDQCAAKGFKGVEPDNLDAYTRSHGLLTQSDAVAYAASLVSYAHDKGLAVGQKNTADLSAASAGQAGFDFAVAEECADFNECQNYTATYGTHVIVIEYTRSQFLRACDAYGSTLSIVLRDVDVTAPGSDSYMYKAC